MNKGFLESLKNSKHLHSSAFFQLNGASISFGGVKALKNINLKIKKGEVLFITGKSGAGKTTLLNVLSGDLKPDTGSASLPGPKFFVAQVFQDLKLFENRTIEENLWYAFDKKIYKNKNEFHSDLLELSSVLGIKERLNQKVCDANGGMKQKVAMLRALLSKPDAVLADEPTAALDKESSSKMFELLNFYNLKKSLTVIWATHNRDLIKQFPGEIAHLEAGKLIYAGKACFI
ncbi:MAG: ATP-binding cassette domain-containing protein [Bacteriovoracaceae bacterium]